MESNPVTIIGVFDIPRNAQHAVQELRRAGFRDDHLGVVSHGDDAPAAEAHSEQENEASAVGTAAVTGSVVGAGAGSLWALGIAAGILPGIGPVIAGGLLASILASAALGAATGGVAGALIGLGVPEDDARFYEDEFKAGCTVVTVKAAGRLEEAQTILREAGAYDVNARHTIQSTSA